MAVLIDSNLFISVADSQPSLDVAGVADDLATPLELTTTPDFLRPPLDLKAAIAADFFATVVCRVAQSVLRAGKV